jgi:hypothetical protein
MKDSDKGQVEPLLLSRAAHSCRIQNEPMEASTFSFDDFEGFFGAKFDQEAVSGPSSLEPLPVGHC